MVQKSEVFSTEVKARMLLELKDVYYGRSLDLEEEEDNSEDVESLNLESSAFESIGGPPQLRKVSLNKNRSKRTEAGESTGGRLSDDIIIFQKRNSKNGVVPAKATKKVWDKKVDKDKKLFVKKDHMLIKLLGLKHWNQLGLNGEDGLQKVSSPPPPSSIL